MCQARVTERAVYCTPEITVVTKVTAANTNTNALGINPAAALSMATITTMICSVVLIYETIVG